MIDHFILKLRSYEKKEYPMKLCTEISIQIYLLNNYFFTFLPDFDETICSNQFDWKTIYAMRNIFDLNKIGISYAIAIVQIPWVLSYLHKYSENKMLYNASSLVEWSAHILFQASSIISIVEKKQYLKVPHKT